ncbi:MAG: tRNA preQ1(34) S-adenosylmethionine ribosyltransferase-isomerase QueA [Desulfobacterales bacterium]|nr:tRNA preQ1(34) S-adenosylmethionine ribosyltransferase-isomerase QueA [Desulfobacterales bacterium]
MFSLHDYNYDLPENLIAQTPMAQRDQARLLVLQRKTGVISHHLFCDIYDLLSSDDLIVINNTEVIPGRLRGRKDTGGKVEVLILDYAGGSKKIETEGNWICQCLVKASKRPKRGASIYFDGGLSAEIINFSDGIYTIKFCCRNDFESHLYQIGDIPLPPYIKRSTDHSSSTDLSYYQTVYASRKGAIAAPTAGLHFSEDLLEKLKSKGIKIVAITLHVGYGTFLPVRVSDIRDHKMYSESYIVPEETAKQINLAKKNNRRIVAVGTTCIRTIEYAADNNGYVASGKGECDLFIYPGYKFKVVDAMVTNFHLPQSTLLMLVSAFAGHKKVMNAYKEAIENRYRFFSYGDAMFVT